MKIPLSSPDISSNEIDAVVKVLKTPMLSLGPRVKEFETKFAKFIGVKHAAAVNSGTSGLHLCVRALGISDGDEVITTPFSFIASSNCMLFERAKPVFVDIREDTLNIDEDKIEEKITKKTKAILPVHVFGRPVNMVKINKIARKYKLKVIEDACEAIGAQIGSKRVGSMSSCAVFAFYPNKQMTTGEGGMVVTNDDAIAFKIKSMRNQGRDSMEWLAHNRLGFNYRLSDINCSLGIVQLERIEKLLRKRSKVVEMYTRQLEEIKGIELPPQYVEGMKLSWFVYVIRLKEPYNKKRDKIIQLLKEDGIGCNSYFPPIHLQPFYVKQFGYKKGDFLITEKVAASTIALPFFNNITREQIAYVAKSLNKNFLKL